MNKFIQIHTLTSYPGTLLNRDDVGFAKRLPLGGVTRTRISSQCLKRHWRTFEGQHSLHDLQVGEGPAPFAVRSRLAFDKFVKEPLVKDGVELATAESITMRLMEEVLGKSAKSKAADEKEKDKPKKGGKDAKKESSTPSPEPIQTNQVVVLGRPELAFLVKLGKEMADMGGDVAAACTAIFTKQQKENIKHLSLGSGLDAALFGRMVTSDILARGDAAIHVAHAFTVHSAEIESDYFSAIDDLEKDVGKLGSGHINSTELSSGLYYGYAVVDVELLIANLSLDRDLAANVVNRLVYLMSTVSPGAKLGSTAPYANASFVMVETGNSQPRTLANAFLKPVGLRDDVLANTYTALTSFLADDVQMYGKAFERKVAARGPVTLLGDPVCSLASVAEFASSEVLQP